MTDRRALSLFAALLWFSATGLTQDAQPTPIFVTMHETPAFAPLKPQQHELAIQHTRTLMFDTAAQLRKQHGDNTKAWPPEVWKVFYEAEDAHKLAIARRDYQPPETRLGLADSVQDVLRAAAGVKNMRVVQSIAEASLAVTVTGRRRTSPPGITDNRYFVRFTMRPGAKLSGDRFVELTRDYKWNPLIATQIVHARDPAGYVELEAGSMASYRQAGGAVRAIVQAFINERLQPAPVKK